MPLIATNKGGSFPLAPAGLQLARIYSIVDLGTQNIVYQGKHQGTGRRIRIFWEMPLKKHKFFEDRGEEPFVLSREYALSTHEKSELRKHLEGWKGKTMTPDEIKSFDVLSLLGKACMINVIHKVKKDGSGNIAKVAGISRIPDEMKANMPGPILPPVTYTIDMGRNEVFKKLPQFVQEQINQSHELASQPQQPEPQSTGEGTSSTPPPPEEDPF